MTNHQEEHRVHDLQRILNEDDAERLQRLLDQGLDARAMDRGLLTLFGAATSAGALGCMRLLVEMGAVVEAGYPSPIQIAIEADRVDLLQELIRLGVRLQTQEDYDPDYPAPIVIAIEARSVEATETLLVAGALAGESWPVVDDAFRAALELRGKSRWAILEALALDLSKRELEIPPDAGSILRALKLLKPRAKKAGDSELQEALDVVSRRLDRAKAELGEAEDAFLEDRFDDLFDLIGEVANARRAGIFGIVAVSATTGCYRFSRWLVESGAAANLCDDEGRTILMHVAGHASLYLDGTLLQTGRAALDAEDKEGRKALDHFRNRAKRPFSQSDPDIGPEIGTPLTALPLVQMDRQVTPVYLRDTPAFVRIAAQLTRERRLPEFLAHLKKRKPKDEEWQLAAGAAVLEDCIADNMTMLEFCLDEGADVNARNDRGNTTLLGACTVFIMPRRILQKIVERGADLSATDARGRTVLTIARRTWPEGHECREYIESLFGDSAEA